MYGNWQEPHWEEPNYGVDSICFKILTRRHDEPYIVVSHINDTAGNARLVGGRGLSRPCTSDGRAVRSGCSALESCVCLWRAAARYLATWASVKH